MVNKETANKELTQVKIFILIITILQLFVINMIGLSFQEIKSTIVISLLLYIFSFILNIVTFIGLQQRKKYGLTTGYISGGFMVINGLLSVNILSLIIAGIWIWSFTRISPALSN